MAMHTIDDLKMRQALPLSMKIAFTKSRIREWVNYYGTDGVYVSFSGGKDSTVLLHLVRELYPDIEAVFVDVPTQYPELKSFATSFPNVTVIRPKLSYMQVVEKYGFPLISKEVSEKVYHARQKPQGCAIKSFIAEEDGGRPAPYNYSKYRFMLDAEFSISHKCCSVMKKDPIRAYAKKVGKVAMTAQMADESMLRKSQWLQHGCNAFDAINPVSNPLSTWTEQDILLYIKENNLPICSVYGDVVVDYEKEGQLEGQMCVTDYASQCGMFDIGNPPLKTTGCQRTGCVLCGFGAQCKGDTRFVDLKQTHAGLYSLLDKVQNNGVTMREAIDWMNEHGNLQIKY